MSAPPRLSASDLAPELRDAYRFFPNPPVRRGWQRAAVRALIGLARGPGQREGRYSFARLGDGVGVHVYVPAGDHWRGGVLWIHGGGLVIGSPAQDHGRCRDLARRLDVVVVSVQYHLAPEHPFPGPLNDCRDAWQWLMEHADDLGVDRDRVAVGGQSAGGGLAAALVQRLHDEGGTQPAAQWLFAPMLDDRTAADRRLDGVRHYVWNNRSNRAGWTAYLGTAPGGPAVADYSVPARRADLSGLPPTWIGTGDLELFHAEDVDYAQRLAAARVPSEIDVVPGAPHAFESIAARTRLARDYLDRAHDWLRTHVEVPAIETR